MSKQELELGSKQDQGQSPKEPQLCQLQEEPAVEIDDQEGMDRERERNIIGTVCCYGKQNGKEFEFREIT